MASTVWKGYISFGLVSVPIRLFVAARDTHVSFNQIHTECGTRVKQQLYCPHDQRVVERSELSKGYPIEKDTYVLVDDKELKAIQPESSEVMEILQFVKAEELDPIYFETSYYSVPEQPGEKAYQLLLKAMEEQNVVGVAKITMHQRERIVTIRPYHGGISLHTIYYPNEVREVAEYGQSSEVKVQPQELKLAEQFVQSLTQTFHPEQYHDEYEKRVLQLIESKGEGKAAPAATKGPHLVPVTDLMDALRRSLEQQTEQKGKQKSDQPAVDPRKKKQPKRAAAEDAEEVAPARRRRA